MSRGLACLTLMPNDRPLSPHLERSSRSDWLKTDGPTIIARNPDPRPQLVASFLSLHSNLALHHHDTGCISSSSANSLGFLSCSSTALRCFQPLVNCLGSESRPAISAPKQLPLWVPWRIAHAYESLTRQLRLIGSLSAPLDPCVFILHPPTTIWTHR